MGWNEQDGNIDGIPVARLYWRLGDVYCSTVTEQELVKNEAGQPLDASGIAIPLVDEKYPKDAVFQYTFPKKIKWHVTAVAYLSREESDEFTRLSKPARKSKVFEFTEPKDSPVELAGNPVSAVYNHPSLADLIPADWVADV